MVGPHYFESKLMNTDRLNNIRVERSHDAEAFSTYYRIGFVVGDKLAVGTFRQGDSPQKVAEALLSLATEVETLNPTKTKE